VLNRLPALHDPYNSSLSLVISIRGHTFIRLNLVNLDVVFGVVEARVEGESVGVGDAATFGGLG
jgi:hypothetical protein